jgi:BMFP domain-containing protein YqiC
MRGIVIADFDDQSTLSPEHATGRYRAVVGDAWSLLPLSSRPPYDSASKLLIRTRNRLC